MVVGCGGDGGTGPSVEEPLDPRIEAPSVVTATPHNLGPYCRLTWQFVGDSVNWGPGVMIFRGQSGQEIGRGNFNDQAALMHGALNINYGIFESARFEVDWHRLTDNKRGKATHDYTCRL